MCDHIRIYVADLAAYNNGQLHGVWINATQDPKEIQYQVNVMLSKSPETLAEEWAIHDYEGFGAVSISEWESFERVYKIALFIDEHGALGAELLSHYGDDLEEAKLAIQDRYMGQFDTLADFAESLTEQTTEIPENIAYYVDYERMGRDMAISGDLITVETSQGEVHVFWSQ